MKKLFLIFACVSIAAACGSSAENTKTNTGENRPNSATAQAKTGGNTSSLNENAYTTASNSSLGLLRPFVGKTANEIKLWNNKDIDPRLEKLMGAEYARMKGFWNTETPVKKFGDFLMMTGCERHNCAANQYVIVINTAEGNINVVHIGKDTSKEWKEYGEITLPPPFADELAAMKSRG